MKAITCVLANLMMKFDLTGRDLMKLLYWNATTGLE